MGGSSKRSSTRVLDFRRRKPDLFARGDYSPLPVKGALEQHIVAFTRSLGRSVVVIVVPRLTHALLPSGDRISFDPKRLRDNTILLPEQLHDVQLRSLLSGGSASSVLPLHAILNDFPMAVLYAD